MQTKVQGPNARPKLEVETTHEPKRLNRRDRKDRIEIIEESKTEGFIAKRQRAGASTHEPERLNRRDRKDRIERGLSMNRVNNSEESRRTGRILNMAVGKWQKNFTNEHTNFLHKETKATKKEWASERQ